MTRFDWTVLGATVLVGSLAGALLGVWQFSRMELGTWDDLPMEEEL